MCIRDSDCDGLTDAADPDMTPPVGLCDTDGACATQTVLSLSLIHISEPTRPY